ncbi:MAG: branched-chain-amino-acid transaminase [Opitutales bacterium]|nr:branched-chain-amino-acid transaminase [Opitutales bacterium]MCH8539936.1 branched-chain-amino-acid transaminase [Opitutales bacterium]
MKIFLDGSYVAQEEAKISVFDHGVLYGDGVFEGIRLYEGCVFRLEEHLERLEYSAKAILLKIPYSRAEMADIVCECCRQNNLRNGYIRLVVTRGVGNLGLAPESCPQPSVFCIADKIQLYPKEFYEKGLDIVTVPTRRINPAALNPAIKSLNYLNNIFARIEATTAGVAEAIMLNDQGYVAECTGDNIFIIHKGKLYTPPASAGALKGITRDEVMAVARELDVPLIETNLTRYDIWNADECFLTGTAAELVPVVSVDRRTIGEGKAGEFTNRFLDAFHQRVIREGTML